MLEAPAARARPPVPARVPAIPGPWIRTAESACAPQSWQRSPPRSPLPSLGCLAEQRTNSDNVALPREARRQDRVGKQASPGSGLALRATPKLAHGRRAWFAIGGSGGSPPGLALRATPKPANGRRAWFATSCLRQQRQPARLLPLTTIGATWECLVRCSAAPRGTILHRRVSRPVPGPEALPPAALPVPPAARPAAGTCMTNMVTSSSCSWPASIWSSRY